MPAKVIAKYGDCLCGIASEFGFIDCAPLRELEENAAFLNRPLAAGDEVTVPNVDVPDYTASVDARHSFKIKSSPPLHIRFVHGSPDLPYRDDTTTAALHISNFVTNLGGENGLDPFHTDFGFDPSGHADPDTFKVEVWDPSAGGSVFVTLEAMKPVYDPVTGELSWTGFNDPKRRIDRLECQQVSAGTANTYRSKYLRLVVDEEDHDSVKCGLFNQTLLVSDLADGKETGAPANPDTVEILDQMVVATYESFRCPGSPKCSVIAVAPIGGDERKRVRIRFHVFRSAPGAETTFRGVTIAVMKQHLRQRLFKWCRRVFAQAGLAPKLMGIEVHDPPPANMICLSHDDGNAVVPGGPIEFEISTPARKVPFPPLLLNPGDTPIAAGAHIAANMPDGFKAEAFECVLARTMQNPACDVIITADNGEPVTIRMGRKYDLHRPIPVEVPRVDLNQVESFPFQEDGSRPRITTDYKRILRAIPVTDEDIHIIVIGRFNRRDNVLAKSFPDFRQVDEKYRPALPFRSAVIIQYDWTDDSQKVFGALDDGDAFPFALAHECAHILCDIGHTQEGTSHNRYQLLRAGGRDVFGEPLDLNNAVDGGKRLCDGPFTVTMLQPETVGTVAVPGIRLATYMRTMGASKMEDW